MEALILFASAVEPSILVAYAAIVVMAIIPIYIGSHRSLNQKLVQEHNDNNKTHKRRLSDSRVLSSDTFFIY